MPGMMENVSTVNSFLRTLIAMVVLGGAGVAGWFGYNTYNAKEIEARAQAKELADATEKLTKAQNDLAAASAEIEQKNATIEEQEAAIQQLNVEVDKLEAKLQLLKVDHRLARIRATEQGTDATTGEPFTVIEFVELNDEGQPIDTPREFRIRGDVVYIDNWIVKFDDKYVEEQDLERGTSLVLFRRIFGEMQQPIDGFPLDEVGQAPRAYARGGQMSDFEKKIFGDFWEIANDEERAKEMGIRAAHGQAVSMKVQKDKTYKVQLRASDGLSIVPEETGVTGER
jgi:outer membrane murein-binding lipoprotein Lpp